MPWFIKKPNETTNEHIELRVMTEEGTSYERIPIRYYRTLHSLIYNNNMLSFLVIEENKIHFYVVM